MAPAQAVKAKYRKHFAPYRGMGIGVCAFGARTDGPGGLEPDACRLLRHLSYARTTRDFEARGLVGTRCDLEEYRCDRLRNFRHILMNCTLLLSLPPACSNACPIRSRILASGLSSSTVTRLVVMLGLVCLSRFACLLLIPLALLLLVLGSTP
jgi:hypothetical protein